MCVFGKGGADGGECVAERKGGGSGNLTYLRAGSGPENWDSCFFVTSDERSFLSPR